MIRKLLLGALALACLAATCLLPLAALAAEVATVGDTAVIVPWGDWLVAFAQSSVEVMLPIVIPLVAAYIIAAVRRLYPWAALFLTQRRVEAMIEHGADYGLNAVRGAAKGKTLTIETGSKVVATSTNYILREAPKRAIEAAGGPEGIAKRVFRKLDLEPEADTENVLTPVLLNLPAAPPAGRRR